ncbi:MAG: HEAT repeat domain-containing protein [Gemmatimonadales bacterium]|nr:HEAT repeat domain-containing protein [Gemmatimonadales bacterium]
MTHALFEQQFGELVALVRSQPLEHAAQDQRLAACTALVASRAVELDAGVELLGEEDPQSLKSRLLARMVDRILILPNADAEELLHLARALAHDSAPLGSTPHVQVQLVPDLGALPRLTLMPSAPEFAPTRSGDDRRLTVERRSSLSGARYRGPERRKRERRASGERRLLLVKHRAGDLERFQAHLVEALRQERWAVALQATAAVLETLPSIPFEDRRGRAMAVRRLLGRPAVEGLIDIALRDPVEAPRAALVLRWIGLDAAEAMLARLMGTETVGPRRVLYEVLGGMPDVFPLVVPFLSRGRWHEVRHAAEILARLGKPEAIDPLKKRLTDPDERVRTAVVAALAEFPLGEVADGLRIALASPSPRTRSAAAEAIGRRRAAAFAMPLLSLLERERDPEAWRAEARALGVLQTPDAVTGLLKVALARRSMLGGGFAQELRLEAVRALAQADGPAARAALDRLAREGDGAVRGEALRLLSERTAAAAG